MMKTLEELIVTPFRGKPWGQFFKERGILVGTWLLTVPALMALETLVRGEMFYSLLYFLIGLKVFVFGLMLQLAVDGLVSLLDRYRQSQNGHCG